MTYKKITKDSYLYECAFCYYNTFKKGDYGRHIQTEKHKNNEKLINSTEKTSIKSYICECGKTYKHNQSLYNHKKKCNIIDISGEHTVKEENIYQATSKDSVTHNMILKLFTENNDIKNLLLIQQQQILEQQKQLGEQQKQLIEIVPTIGNITNNTTFTDIYSGYIIFKRDLIDHKNLIFKGWAQQAEILTFLKFKSKKIYEAPITYKGRSYGEGKKITAAAVAPVLFSMFWSKLRLLFIKIN